MGIQWQFLIELGYGECKIKIILQLKTVF